MMSSVHHMLCLFVPFISTIIRLFGSVSGDILFHIMFKFADRSLLISRLFVSRMNWSAISP
jgi:hypothetical protein